MQAVKPNPTRATPVHKVPGLADKPIIKVPGCPPIAEVMTAVVAYLLTFDKLPTLDKQGRPQMFYSQRIHDKCYRRPHFDAGQFVEHWDDDAARQGHCLYKMGYKGPTTYNACSTVRWNEGTSFPIQAGHGCIGCSEDGFWDKGGFYEPLTNINQFGIEANADAVGGTAAVMVGAGIAAHVGLTALNRKTGTALAWTECPGDCRAGGYRLFNRRSVGGEAFEHYVMGYVRFAHFAAGYVLAAALVFRLYWAYVGNEHAR